MDPVLLTPHFAGVVTLLIIVAGGLFSLYAEDIKGAWPIHFFASGPISYPALWSWSVAIIAAAGFFWRQSGDDRARKSAQNQLVRQAEQLEKMIRTMPPAKFLATFSDFCHAVDKLAVVGAVAADHGDIADLEQSIRSALSAIAGLARIFDGDFPSHRYAANVMIFVPTSEMDEQYRTELERGKLKFCEDDFSVSTLMGVLDLVPELSAEWDKDSKDERITSIALPVPKRPKDKDLYKALPGAPRAFWDNAPDIYFDLDQLMQWCEDEGDFTATVKGKIRAYFEENKDHVSSFISIPLQVDVAVSGENQHPFAVLNVHCGRPGLLRREPEAVGNFVMIATPLLINLRRLLYAWKWARSKRAQTL